MRSTRSFALLRSWLIPMSALFVFTAAACGGDDDDASAGVDSADSNIESGGGEDGADEPDGDDATSGPAGATVTVDGVTYEAGVEQSCTALGGGLGAAFSNEDNTLTITIALYPEDGEDRPSVRVDDESDPDDTVQWESGGETIQSNPGFNAVANVREHTVDGRSGSGSAVFIDTTKMLTGTAEPLEGTFAVQCADV